MIACEQRHPPHQETFEYSHAYSTIEHFTLIAEQDHKE